MTEFRQKVSKTSARMKGIVKWFRMQDVSEFLSCSLQRKFFGSRKKMDNLRMAPIFVRLFFRNMWFHFFAIQSMFLTQTKSYFFTIRHPAWKLMQHSIFWKIRARISVAIRFDPSTTLIWFLQKTLVQLSKIKLKNWWQAKIVEKIQLWFSQN